MRDHHGSEHRSHRQPRARNRCSTEGPGRDCPLPNRSPQRELGDCDVAHRLKTARLKRWAAWLRGGKRDGVCARSPRARARGLYEGLRPPCRIEALSASWGTATERTSWRQPGSSGDAYPGRHGRHGCGVASETAFVPAVPGLAPGACMRAPEASRPTLAAVKIGRSILQGRQARNRNVANSTTCTAPCIIDVRPVPSVTALTSKAVTSSTISFGSSPRTSGRP